MEDFKTALKGQFIASFRTGSSFICDPPVLDTDLDVCVMVHSISKASKMLEEAGWVVSVDDPEYMAETNNEITFITARKGDGVSTNLIIYEDWKGYHAFEVATLVAQRFNLLDKDDRVTLFKAVLSGRGSDDAAEVFG